MKKTLLIAMLIVFATGGLYAVFGDEPGFTVAPPNPAEGQIVSVTSDVIVLETDDGTEHEFVNRADISTTHLREHQSDNQPVSITWHSEGNKRIATRIEDAP